MNDPVRVDLFRRLSLANLESWRNDPSRLLMKAAQAMNEAVRSSEFLTGYRSLHLFVDDWTDELVLTVQVTEHSGTRLRSPREVRMEFKVSELVADMVTVRDVMDS